MDYQQLRNRLPRGSFLRQVARRRWDLLPLYTRASLWLDPSWGVFTDSAGSFASASSQSLSVASNSTLQAGDVAFLWAGWVNITSGAANTVLVNKWGGGNTFEYQVLLSGTSLIQFSVSPDGTTAAIASVNGTVVSTGSWQFVVAYHDPVANEIGISLNGGAFTTASYSTGVFIGTSTLILGSRVGASYLNGLMDSWVYCKNIVGGFATTSAATIAAALYNGGNGLKPSQITPTQRTAWGVVSGWLDNAQSSLTADAIGSNTLTNNNTVTVGAGAILTPASIGNVVSRWVDRSTGVLFTQSTLANRPTLQVSGGRLVVRFDGTNDFMTGSPTGASTIRTSADVFVGVNVTSNGGAYDAYWGATDAAGGSGNFQIHVSSSGGKGLGITQPAQNLVNNTTANNGRFVLRTTASGSLVIAATAYGGGGQTVNTTLTNTSTATTTIILGAANSGGIDNLPVEIDSFIYFTRPLSTGEASRVLRFMGYTG